MPASTTTAPLVNLLTHTLTQIRVALNQLDTERLARETGFLKRRPRKISMTHLLTACCALAGESALSLERVAAMIGLAAGCSYAKQSLHQRLGQSIEPFLLRVILALFGQLGQPLRATGYLAPFRRVLLHDSTVQSLPRRLAACFPGCRDQKVKDRAALKIQWVCDLLAGSLVSLSLSSYRRNDQAAAPDILACVSKGDLVVRDLGYFSLPVFAQIMARGAYFLSRLRNGVILRDPRTKQLLDLPRLLRRQGGFDGPVLVGEECLLLRLVVLPVPEALANQRRGRAKSSHDRRSTPTATRLALMSWNLFLTNVDQSTWPTTVVAQIYGLRWRIEIIFKSWKSHLRLRELNCRTADLVRLSVLIKLLYALLANRCYQSLETLPGCGRQLSLLRLSKALAQAGLFLTAVLVGKNPAHILGHYLAHHIFYERRADRQNFPQRLCGLMKN
jgi:hypothetical protein